MSTRQTAIAAGVAALCVAPSAIANVLPHLLAVANHGAIDSAEATTAVFQGVSVIAMGAMPFGAKNLRAVTLKLACWLLAVILFGLNLLNALDAASHALEVATGGNRGTIAKAMALQSRISELRGLRAQVPQFTFTSAAQATAAQEAVRAAEAAQNAECGKAGPNCRKRVDEVTAAAGKLSKVLDQRALTERAEKLDSEVTAAEKQLIDLGPVPKHGDDTASKAARLIGAFVSIGGDADETISEWRPIAFATGIELLALIGPIGMVAAVSAPLAPAPGRPAAKQDQPVQSPPAEETAATPKPRRRRTRKKKPDDPVKAFLQSCTSDRFSDEATAAELHAAFSAYANRDGQAPLSATALGRRLSALGCPRIKRGGVVRYQGVTIPPGARLN